MLVLWYVSKEIVFAGLILPDARGDELEAFLRAPLALQCLRYRRHDCVGVHLRAVHGPRTRLLSLPFLYIEPYCDEFIGQAELFGIEARKPVVISLLAHPLDHHANATARERSIIEFGDGVRGTKLWILHSVGGSMIGSSGVAIDSDMIGMTIAAGFVERDHDLRAKFADNCHQLAYDLRRAGLNKGACILIFGRTFHAGIAVAQEPELTDVQRLSRRAHLLLAHLTQRLRRCQRGIGNLADLASCCINQPGFHTQCMIL